MSAFFGLIVGGWMWIDSGNVATGVIAFLFIWFVFTVLDAFVGLLTSKEGGVILGVLAIFGLGFLLGGDDDCDV